MADEDEIDILGDFSFNSCLAQNDQGIPTCSNNEDTVHPEWLSDSTINNWYDRSVSNSSINKRSRHTSWSNLEKDLLVKEMNKYGRDPKRIAIALKTKNEGEIRALIEAEYGINLDTSSSGLHDINEVDGIPTVVQEEVIAHDDVSDSIHNMINLVTTGKPTVSVAKSKRQVFAHNKGKKTLKPDVLLNSDNAMFNSDEIFYDDDLIIGSVELVDTTRGDVKKIEMKSKTEVAKKIGNHRRKDKVNLKNKKFIKDVDRQRKSLYSMDGVRSPKLQIVLGSGQALPVSEGEQVIKIEKKKNSDSESDIEIDIDSGAEEEKGASVTENNNKLPIEKINKEEGVQIRRFEPMPRRRKKFNLEGRGGCTIMHTEAGDLYEISTEPRKERAQKKQNISLIPCRVYNADKPAPYSVLINISSLISMELQTHSSSDEVMGLCGGYVCCDGVVVSAYWPAAAAAGATHCDMCPVSQAAAAERLLLEDCRVIGWHHSHPCFPASPSATDITSQRAMQEALEGPQTPFLGLITSQLWGTGRTASHYKCIRVELDPDGSEVGYQLSVKLQADLTVGNLGMFIVRLREMMQYCKENTLVTVDMQRDICPQANITYLDKCLLSIRHHLRSAGYEDDHTLPEKLLTSIRDIFR